MTATAPLYDEYEPEFSALVNKTASLETLYSNCRWAEGPVWFGDGNYLLWSDIPNNTILRYIPDIGVSIFRANSGNTNGHYRDLCGRLVSCSHANRRIERTEFDGTITTLADSYEGKKLNSPNDLVVKSDGTIWFTDPAYGIESDYEGNKAPREQAGCFVFCFDPKTNSLTKVADDFDRPNGLAFSLDEKQLYIADTGMTHGPDRPRHIRVLDVNNNNTLSGGKVFAEISPGLPDGFRLDIKGNIWTSAGDGVHILNRAGVTLGKIRTPKPASNLTFGGPEKNRLFITATDCVHAVYVSTNGAQFP